MIPILPELIQTGKKYRYTFNMIIHTWKSIIHKIQGRLSLITTLGQRYKNNILWYVSLLNTYTHARRDCYTGTDGCNVKTKLSPALSRGSNVFYNKYIRKYRAAWDFSTQKRNVYSQYNGSNLIFYGSQMIGQCLFDFKFWYPNTSTCLLKNYRGVSSLSKKLYWNCFLSRYDTDKKEDTKCISFTQLFFQSSKCWWWKERMPDTHLQIYGYFCLLSEMVQ